jgi:flagellar motor switch/type III secretory pathway protein FliN
VVAPSDENNPDNPTPEAQEIDEASKYGPKAPALSLEEIDKNIDETKSKNDTKLEELTSNSIDGPGHATAPSIEPKNRQTKHANPDDVELAAQEESAEQQVKKPKHQVTLTFEISDQRMPLSELETIDKGYVFSCDNPVESPITICANGTPIGSGELVNVCGKTGVRILEIFDK